MSEYADFYDPDADTPHYVDELDPEALQAHAEALGYDSWDEVEQQWQAEDAEQAARAQAEHEQALAASYSDHRLGILTRNALDELGGDEIHLPALHDVAGQLLADRDWLLKHGLPVDTREREFGAFVRLSGEPLVAQALKDAARSLTPATNENEALERYLLRKGG